jgi:hypothetical protein
MATSCSWFLVVLILFCHGLAASSRHAAAEPAARVDFWVATNGRDGNPGTVEKPFATPARARAAVRQLRSGGPRTSGCWSTAAPTS